MVETISVGDELRELIRAQSWQQLRERLTELDASEVGDVGGIELGDRPPFGLRDKPTGNDLLAS